CAARIDNLLHRSGGEDGVALIDGEGETWCGDRVLSRPARDLEGGADILHGECRTGRVGARYGEAAHRAVRQIEHRIGRYQLVVRPPTIEARNTRGIGTVDLQREV